MRDGPHVLAPLATRLSGRGDLTADDVAAILALPHQERRFAPGGYVVQEGDRATACQIMLTGFAHRHRFSAEGLRHIVGIHGQGDILNFPSMPPSTAEDFVQALGPVTIAIIPTESLLGVCQLHPRVANALWAEVEAEISVVRAWISNMGRRDARGRIAHLFCEFAMRDHPNGGHDGCEIMLPLTQAELADATGMTTVHVNRTLKALESESFIERDRRRILVPDWRRLTELADFRPRPWFGRSGPHPKVQSAG